MHMHCTIVLYLQASLALPETYPDRKPRLDRNCTSVIFLFSPPQAVGRLGCRIVIFINLGIGVKRYVLYSTVEYTGVRCSEFGILALEDLIITIHHGWSDDLYGVCRPLSISEACIRTTEFST